MNQLLLKANFFEQALGGFFLYFHYGFLVTFKSSDG